MVKKAAGAEATPDAAAGKGKKPSADTIGKAGPKGVQKQTAKPAADVKAVVAEVKASGGKKKASEIEDIFGTAAKKAKEAKEAKAKEAENAAAEANAKPAKKGKLEGSKDDIFGEVAAKGRKKTEEGFNIYTEDELGLGKKGGETDLCPFDCECCF